MPIGGKKQLKDVEIRGGVAGLFGPVTIVRPFILKAPGTGGGAAAVEAPDEGAGGEDEEVRICLSVCVHVYVCSTNTCIYVYISQYKSTTTHSPPKKMK